MNTMRRFFPQQAAGGAWFFTAVCLALILTSWPCWAESWKAGVARAKITPEPGMWMAGYALRDHPAEGTLQDLWIKALGVEDGRGCRAVVVTCDFLGFTRALSEEIAAQIEKRFAVPRANLMFTASHTHCGPVIEGALYDIYPLDETQRRLITEYTRQLSRTAIDVIAAALGSMEEVELWAGEGRAEFAVNRRNNREVDVPAMREAGRPLVGPSDFRVPVLCVRSRDGRAKALVFGYACHATVLSFYQWCGDYPGFAQENLESRLPGVTAMFYTGCGADQNALPRRTVELAQVYGRQLADAVAAVLERPMRPVSPRLSTSFERIRLDYEVVDREYLEKSRAQGGYIGRWAERLLGQLAAGAVFANSYEYPVQVWLLGEDQWWIALGGEVVVDYSLRLVEKYGPSTWVAGYSNDVMAYIPSRRVWEEGGYESGAFTVYGLPAKRWTNDIEERIYAAIAAGMEQCRQLTACSATVGSAGQAR